jgi:hypothetical protein
MNKPVTISADARRCYNTAYQRGGALHRCRYYATCLRAGCDEHMPEFETREGMLHLCGKCRPLRAIAYREDHLIGLRPRERGD